MTINTSTVVSMTEANQNFSKVTRLVDQFGAAVIFKNNTPHYLVIDLVKSKIVCKFFQVQSKSGSGFHGCSVKRTCLSVEIFAVLQAKIQPLAS